MWLHNCIGQGNYVWFIGFLVVSLLDFAAQGFIATCDYLGLFTLESKNWFQSEIGLDGFLLFVAIINAFGIVFITRLLGHQVQKACKSLKRRKIQNSSQVALSPYEVSDTGSMLLKSSEDWTINSLSHN